MVFTPSPSEGWRKFHGEKFVFENIEKRGDDFARQISTFEAKIVDEANFMSDIVLKSGKKMEYKSWKQSSFKRLLNGDQAKNQLKAYIQHGDFEYVVDAKKLLNDGVLDPDKFVKGEFQKVFKDNAERWFKSIEDGGELLNKQQLEKLFGTDNLSAIKGKLNDIEDEFYKQIIKVE
jgi:hypothetical protein